MEQMTKSHTRKNKLGSIRFTRLEANKERNPKIEIKGIWLDFFSLRVGTHSALFAKVDHSRDSCADATLRRSMQGRCDATR